MEKAYLLDVIRIVEGAANADPLKVNAYAEQLVERLESDGEINAAKRLRQILSGGKAAKLGIARMAGKGRKSDSGILPVDSESRLTTAEEEFFEDGSVEVYLSQSENELVQKFLLYYRGAGRLIAEGIGVASSMLMFGPPGCGKTLLAKYIAAELGLPLITARVDGLISSYLGSTAKNVRLLFEHAMSRPCVLFLDEFDAIAKMRDDTRELGELKRVVIGLLQNIDAMGTEHVLLAATNHEHLLDPAIWRRFAYKIQILEPEFEARQNMARSFLRKFGDDQLAQVIAVVTDGMTGSQIKLAIENCIRDAILKDVATVTPRDAISSVQFVRTGRTSDDNEMAKQIIDLRHRDPKLFTQVRLAELFGISQGQVSKLLKDAKS